MSYVEVPRDAIEQKLQDMGFSREQVHGEVTYSRTHHANPRLSVLVYTSCAEFSQQARDKDADAIRVVGLLRWRRKDEQVDRRKTIFKAKILRVTSVEGVLERVHMKAREAYAALNEFQKQKKKPENTGESR